MPKISVTGYELMKEAFYGLHLRNKLPKLDEGEEWIWNFSCTNPKDKKTFTMVLESKVKEKKVEPEETPKQSDDAPAYKGAGSWKED